jgi:hypothetical protein
MKKRTGHEAVGGTNGKGRTTANREASDARAGVETFWGSWSRPRVEGALQTKIRESTWLTVEETTAGHAGRLLPGLGWLADDETLGACRSS